ncbi:MAG: glycosyltransferase family A protein [Candidatus Omnitrophota bacterium]|nr:glycosyltransferase family 2 protein [Candidatus Omnitrophota bacterium]
MEHKPLVSVIIPVYNGERFLAEAVRSVLVQIYQPIEVIVVDDGSTDASASIAKEFGAALRYCSIQHGGPAAARNEGVRLAKGEFLSFLDADDVWEEDKLAIQAELFAHQESLDMCFTGIQQFLSSGSKPPAGSAEMHYGPQAGYHCSALMVKKDAFFRVGLFNEAWRTGEFIDWYARAKSMKLTEAVAQRVLVKRRIHEHNFTRGQRHNTKDYARILKEVIDRRRNDPQ